MVAPSETLPFVPPAPVARPRSARVANDPDKYLRTVKGGKVQARPYLEGVRYNLGLFPTKDAARKAIQEFWWGRVKERLRFARPYPHKSSLWIAVVPIPDSAGRVRLLRVGGASAAFPSSQDAHRAACRWLRRKFGRAAAERIIRPTHMDRGSIFGVAA
jgi:hypothetical protein